VLVVPLTPSYSYLDAGDEPDAENDAEEPGESAESAEEPANPDAAENAGDHPEAERPDITDRDAIFIGLGDAVMPTVMVASAAFFAEAEPLVSGIALNLPALTSLLGTMAGLLVLLWMVLKGRAHAGLPLLNGGAIGGYLVGALASGLTLTQALGL
jgi:presenilin-like A22 family membrane protease